MSFYEYVAETNTLYAVRGRTKPKVWIPLLQEQTEAGGVSHVSQDNGEACIRISEFLDEYEHAGALGEEAFKAVLERSRIPFLYIGQGPFGLEMSETLKRDAGAKRPDFLINFADLGHILVDVKVRRKVGFPEKEGRYFSLGVVEVEALWTLQKTLGVQVWIAFAERQFNSGPLPGFSLVPASKLKDLLDGLFARLGPEGAKDVVQLRIPDELLHSCPENLEFRISWSQIPDALLDAYAHECRFLYQGLRVEVEHAAQSGGTEEEIVARVFKRYTRWIQRNELGVLLPRRG